MIIRSFTTIRFDDDNNKKQHKKNQCCRYVWVSYSICRRASLLFDV